MYSADQLLKAVVTGNHGSIVGNQTYQYYHEEFKEGNIEALKLINKEAVNLRISNIITKDAKEDFAICNDAFKEYLKGYNKSQTQ